ncbi:MAG: PAS domain-containing protein, partial [Chloroflexi bacterium]|nr:PAS domain-containing protein [Chloroflexota bacterium]
MTLVNPQEGAGTGGTEEPARHAPVSPIPQSPMPGEAMPPHSLDELQRRRLLLDSAGVGEWELDIPTGLVWRSPALLAIYGTPGGVGVRFDDYKKFVAPEDQATLLEAHRRAAEGDAGFNVEFRVIRPDGGVRWVHSMGALVRDEAGQPRRLFGIALDITARKRYEEA